MTTTTEYLKDKYEQLKPVLNITIIIITLYILYKLYQYLNIEYRITQIIPYSKSLKWEEIPMCWYDDKYNNSIVADFFTSSSINTACMGNLKYDYLHLDVIKKVLLAGARYIEFSVMANDLSDHPTPVVSRGNKEGQWQTQLNNLLFDEVCYTIKKFAFQSYMDNNQQLRENTYPLFIYLDIKSDNINLINDIGLIIEKIFGNRLTSKKHNYAFIDLAHVPICEIFGKIIIMSNAKNIEGTQLDGLINYKKLKRLHVKELNYYNFREEAKLKGIKIKEDSKNINELNLKDLTLDSKNMGLDIINSPDHLTKYTKSNLVLVYSNLDSDTQLTNSDFSLAMSYGCQFVGMNFQEFDTNMKNYVKIFEKCPFKLKNKSLRLDRSEIKKGLKPLDTNDLFEQQILRGADILYNGYSVSIVPYYVDGVYMKFQNHTYKMGIANMPIPKKSKSNPLGFLPIDLFRIVPSISQKRDTISFKSIRYPNYYLVVQNNEIKLLSNEHTDKYNLNATFYILMDDENDENDIQYFKFVPYNDKKKHVRVLNESLIIDEYEGQDTFKDEIKFRFIKVPIELSYSFKDYKNKYLRILDGGFLTSNAPNLSTDTKFKIRKAEENHYHIMASNGKYLKYDNIKTVSAVAKFAEGTHTMFEIKKHGPLYQISTYHGPKNKTIYPKSNGNIDVLYDGNLIKPRVVDDNGNTIEADKRAPKLGRQKYFHLVQSYDIKKD